jgi:hypothetical protein
VFLLLAAGAQSPAAAAGYDPYGAVSLSGVYSTESSLAEVEELDGSALVARGYAGVRFNPRGNSTRFQVASNYFGYFDRENRWSNALEAEQVLRLGNDAYFSVEASAASNVLTLERRSTDQTGIVGRLRLEPGNHRVTLGAGTRRRWYDDSRARSWAPFVEAEYRYRLGSWHSLALEGRVERVNSDFDTLDYDRLALGAFYTRPLSRDTRVRAALVHRRWTWDERFTLGGDQRRERLWLPQLRLTHEAGSDVELELDARRVIRRSNDERFDRSGSRLAATVRKTF